MKEKVEETAPESCIAGEKRRTGDQVLRKSERIEHQAAIKATAKSLH
jgi:hypothetical protein